MFELIRKKNSAYSKLERVLISLFSFLLFATVGAILNIAAIFNLPSTGDVTRWDIFQAIAPYAFGFGVPAALAAYFLPKPFRIILFFIPLPVLES